MKSILIEKRAEDTMTPIIYMIIGIIVVAIVAISLAYYGVPQKLKDLFPSFNNDSESSFEDIQQQGNVYPVIQLVDYREEPDYFWILWNEDEKKVLFKFKLMDEKFIFEDTEGYDSLSHLTAVWLEDPRDDKYFLNKVGVEEVFRTSISSFVNDDSQDKMTATAAAISKNPYIEISFWVYKNNELKELKGYSTCEKTKEAMTQKQISACMNLALTYA